MKYSCIKVFSVNSGWNEIAIFFSCWIAIILPLNVDKTLIFSFDLSYDSREGALIKTPGNFSLNISISASNESFCLP